MPLSISHSCLLLSLILIYYVNGLQSQPIKIISAAEIWYDDDTLDITGVNGWSYPPSALSTIISGSERSYHGWYYNLNDWQYAGYYYRKFQCEYDSTVSVTFDAFFGCYFEDSDGAVLYINENKFMFDLSDNTITKFTDITDETLLNKSNECIYFPGQVERATLHFTTIEVQAFTTFDVGFTMFGMDYDSDQEFAALSDITIGCNKLDPSELTPQPRIDTPAPTVRSITAPNDHIACSEISDLSECNSDYGCGWDSNVCTCTGGDSVDIIFGIYSELGLGDADVKLKNWFTNDVFTNINFNKSRVGMISFQNTVQTELNIGYHTMDELNTALNNINWKSAYQNFQAFFGEVISEFDTIPKHELNTQQILIIMTDDKPYSSLSRQDPLCQYRNAFALRNIRVIPVLVNVVANSPQLAAYDCILQHSFDGIITPRGALNLENMHTITNTLSAVLCPDFGFTHQPTTAEPTVSPTAAPTPKPSLPPTHSGYDKIEVIVVIPTEVEIIELIAIVSNTTGLDRSQISVQATDEDDTYIILIVGTEAELDEAEQRVEEDLQNDIEQQTGTDIQILDVSRTNNNEDSEMKDLIIYLILTICVLILVILCTCGICIYCLFIRKRTVKLKEGLEFGAVAVKRQSQSIPSAGANAEQTLPAPPLQQIAMRGHMHVSTVSNISNFSVDSKHIRHLTPEMLRVQTEGDMHNIILNMNIVTDGNLDIIDTKMINEMFSPEENEEEVNEMYFPNMDEVRKRERTMTKTGEIDMKENNGNEDMYFSHPIVLESANNIHKQMSLTPHTHMKGMDSLHLHGSITPINLTPKQSPRQDSMVVPHMDIATQITEIMQEELSQNLPLPNEDDNDVIKDMKSATTSPKHIMSGEDNDSDDNNDHLYGKGSHKKQGNTEGNI